MTSLLTGPAVLVTGKDLGEETTATGLVQLS
jgi:hypothetical protein